MNIVNFYPVIKCAQESSFYVSQCHKEEIDYILSNAVALKAIERLRARFGQV